MKILDKGEFREITEKDSIYKFVQKCKEITKGRELNKIEKEGEEDGKNV